MSARATWALAALLGCSRSALRVDPDAEALAPADVRPAGPNACGGRAALDAVPGAPCGACGVFVCASPEAVACDDRDARNACGECGPAPAEECNGRDDDCDGWVDEGCARRLGPAELSTGSVRLSGDHAVLDRPVVVTLPAGTTRDLSAPPLPPDAGMAYRYDGTATIDGDWVAWERHQGPPAQSALVVHDLATGAEYEVAQPGYRVAQPAADRGRVVYELHRDDRDGGVDVWLWDAATRAAAAVTGAEGDETSPDLSGDWLVFERAIHNDWTTPMQVVARNLRTAEELVLSTGLVGWSRAPVIDGDRVVWWAGAGLNATDGPGQVVLYDLATRSRTLLTQRGSSFRPRISGTLVCWSSSPTEPPYGATGPVSLRDLATGRTLEVTARGQLCDVAGRRVAFLELFDWDGRPRAYYRDLLPGEP